MSTTKLLTRFVTIATVFVLALSGVSPAYAAAPSNDNFGSATIIGALPFGDSVDISEATGETDEPQTCTSSLQSVWYSLTPAANAVMRANLDGTNFGDTAVSVYQDTGSGLSGLNFLSCTNFSNTLTFNVQSGVTYYIQAGKYFGGSGILSMNLQEVPPPANNDFASATGIASPLPFNDTIDTLAATVEADEPTPSCGSSSKTAWYSFRPTTSGSISANFNFTSFTPILAAYTGTSLTDLTEVGCRAFGGVLTFHANADTNYFIQVGGLFGDGGPLDFRLAIAPAPTAGICFGPSDPSVFDSMQFNDCSSDPGGADFQSFTWNFGDGFTLTTQSCCVNHQYAKDGDYNVQHTMTTVDGRNAATSQVVQVRTKDVAITTFSVPQTARVNQTKTINVNIQNKRYADYVQVTLYKGLPGGGEQQIGTLMIYVPAKAKQATIFKFSYTFTADDAKVGKVTFRAVADLVNGRDAFTSDNTSIATTLVSK
ncbi:MAG TPA: PKD domain-containing protein [Anaerolineales bacterium]|nr:PKD domain-containing protein [Anaerolineales bacterium]